MGGIPYLPKFYKPTFKVESRSHKDFPYEGYTKHQAFFVLLVRRTLRHIVRHDATPAIQEYEVCSEAARLTQVVLTPRLAKYPTPCQQDGLATWNRLHSMGYVRKRGRKRPCRVSHGPFWSVRFEMQSRPKLQVSRYTPRALFLVSIHSPENVYTRCI